MKISIIQVHADQRGIETNDSCYGKRRGNVECFEMCEIFPKNPLDGRDCVQFLQMHHEN